MTRQARRGAVSGSDRSGALGVHVPGGQSRCFSEGLVDVVGIDKIKAAGPPEEFADDSDGLDFEAMDLTREQGEDIYGQFDECGMDQRVCFAAHGGRG